MTFAAVFVLALFRIFMATSLTNGYLSWGRRHALAAPLPTRTLSLARASLVPLKQ